MRKVLILLVSLVLFTSILAGCKSAPKLPVNLTVDWSMTAFLIRSDGTVTDTFPMTISGTIRKEETDSYLDLDIDVPEDFRYIFYAEDGGSPCLDSQSHQSGDFILGGCDYDRIKNAPAMSYWAVNTEKEYFISYWGAEFGQYLVAATNPDVTPAEIMEHFEKFVELYSIN